MNKKWVFFLSLTIALSLNAIAQQSSAVLMKIGNDKVSADEFWAVYQKNSRINQESEKTSLKDYLDLYINFKLKVKEAKEAKMDTSAAFKKELAGYRKQLAKPYLVDEKVNEQTLHKVYQRMLSNVRVSHILLRLKENASPADTLAAYQKAMQIRNEIVNNKITFADAAVKYSEDPSARPMNLGGGRPIRPGNKGDLGYFSVFDMVYPFEEAAFGLNVGEISQPVRTRFGYHLIYQTDKIPAVGQLKAAHIFIKKTKPSAVDTAKIEIDKLYKKIEDGASFESIVAQDSQDRGSNKKGGVLPLFTANRMVPEFISALSKMKIGEVSKPIKTNFGWHIVKFLDQKPIKSFDEEKEQIKEKLKRDIRSHKGEQAKVAEIKAEEHFKEYPVNLNEAIAQIDTNFYHKNFDIKSLASFSKPIFSIRDRIYSQFDFLTYVFQRKASAMPANFANLIHRIYKDYEKEMCLNFEEEHLEEKYFDFRLVMNEYHDGMLLFDLMDKKIWSKASEDTLGLEKFFEVNRKKYTWKKRAEISVYSVSDSSYSSKLQSYLATAKSDEEIMQMFQDDSLKLVKRTQLKIEKGDSAKYDKLKWKKGAYYVLNEKPNQNKSWLVFRDILAPEPKKLSETRGVVIADYQDYLEKKWIDQLKKRYPVQIDKKVFRSLKERENK